MVLKAIIYDDQNKRWLKFEKPLHFLSTSDPSKVVPLLQEIEHHVVGGNYAAGFLCYEGASAFDRAHKVRMDSSLPLCSFGIFEKYDDFHFPDDSYKNFAIHKKLEIEKDEFVTSFEKIKSYII